MQPVEQSQRARRVRFKHPVRVATIDGEPRAWRTLAANISRDGLFVRMPQPLDPGTRVAISLEAAGQTLPLAQGEVRWCRYNPSEFDGRFQGCGVRFTGFLHPRAPELVSYLVDTLDTGKPLMAAPPKRRRWPWAAAAGLAIGSVVAGLALAFARPEPPPLPTPSGDPGALGVLAVAPKVNDELASMVSPAEEEEPGEGEVAAPTGNVAVGPSEPDGTGATPDVAVAPSAPIARAAAMADMPSVPTAAPGTGATPDVAVAPSAPIARAAAMPDVPSVPTAAPGTGETPDVAVAPSAPTARAAAMADVPSAPTAAPGTGATPDVVGVRSAPAPSAAAVTAPTGARGTGATEQVADVPASRAAPRKGASAAGHLALATGAAASLTWTSSPDGLEVRPTLRGEAKIARVFALADPPRLVFDIDGAAPKKSLSLATPSPLISRVRLGKQGARTRVVLDLASSPHHVRPAADHAVVQF